MRVLHINTNGNSGGAAIAAKRHHEAMLAAGIDSRMLVFKGIPSNHVSVYHNKSVPLFQKIKDSLVYRFSTKLVEYAMWNVEANDFDITGISEVMDADIIYMHWVSGFLGTKAIAKLAKTGKPIVWYMHDMNPLTGGCHHSFGCNEYQDSCGRCPEIRYFKRWPYRILKQHIQAWNPFLNLIGVAPSQWLTNCIRKSIVFRKHPVFCIPNVIDTEVFTPHDKNKAREKYNLPKNKKLIMFASMGAYSRYKGYEYLRIVIDALSSNENYEFIVAGTCQLETLSMTAQNKIHVLGMIYNEEEMAEAYSAADVYLITSMAENFPNVIIESMACEVPAVGFATGGIKDQIHHMENGWIVEPKDTDGLIQGINWVLNDADSDLLGYNARQYVVENCSYQNVLKLHADILQMIK